MAEEKELSKIGEVKQREIVQEMKDSYMDYAMSVIVSRALPDVRDGLKPVHRRILFSMHELGLTHLAKFRKSALVVGDTLGKFHPHGDQAVYGSLARMAQDFSLRYPLINGQGNFGSIDNDPPAAMRYCITGDSLVVTNRCLEEIASVSKKEDISLKVLSFGKKINSASKLFDSGVHPILRAETFRGYNLKGSFNHPILTLGQNPETGAPMFEWKLLETLKNSDYAVIDRNDQLLWPKKEPSLKKFHPKIRNRKLNIHKLPSQMSPDLAFLIGAIIAEGHISINKKKNYAKIGFCNTNEEYLNAFKKAFKNLFPDCHKYEAVRKPLSYGKKEFTSIEICSTQIAEFLMNLGVKAVPSSEKQVPNVVLDSTKESVAAFLRGFVEGDGSIYSSSVKRSFQIAFISTSKKLLEQIQIVLLRFGADSFLRYEPTRSMWRLFLRGRENLNIFKEIGFVSKKKKERLEEYCQRNSDHHVMSKTDFVPFLSEYLKSKYKNKKIKWIFKEWLIKHNIDRYSKLKNYRSYLEQFIEKEDLALIDLFVNNNYLFDKIASVEKAGEERVYSFRVDSGCHSFVSNGFISHNTEARMSKLGEELLRNIAKDTVEFRPNYDGTRKEPVVLPCPVPQLLLNGTLGIAVGMATSIPPHNLGEVCDALTHIIDNPKANTEDVFEFIKGPDFPTAGMIYGRKDIIETYKNGRGPIVIRGKAEIKESEKLSQILITEIPYQTPKSTLIEQFAKLVQDKKIDGIRDIRDESDKDGMRIAIDLQKGAYPSKILNRLYKFSDLQRTFHLNMIALVDGIQPKSLTLPEILNYFIEHRKEVVVRRSKFELKKAEERAHILEGLHKCLSKIDTVIKIIKASKSREDAVKNLIKEIEITEIQANAILETKLATLAKLEREKIENELKELKIKIKELMDLLNSPQKIKTEIKKEIQEMKEKFGDERRTKVLVQRVGEIAEEDLIPQEETMITVTQGGYIKRINPTTYKIQKRGGKGIMGMKTLQEDIVEHFLTAQTHDSLFFFTDSGKVFQTVAYEIPEGSRVARGRGLLNFLELSSDEKALSLLSFGKNEEEAGIKDLVMVTKDGVIKRTKLEEFKNVRKSGLIAINLKKGDLLKKAVKTTGENDIMLVTKKGQSIRFKEQDIREMGRPAAGVRGIALKKDDEVVGMDVVDKTIEEKQYLLIVMANGYGKKTDVKEYRKQGRGGSGIKTANVTPKTGEIIYAKVITDDVEDLIVISQQGQVIRTKISSIAKISRSTQGVRIMKLADGDKVASAASI